MPDGSLWCPARGSLIRIAEWYGAETDSLTGKPAYGTNTGLKLGSSKIAMGILERERRMIEDGWIHKMPTPGPADGQIYNVNDDDTDSIADIMERHGVRWIRADKSPGSRINGLELFRDMLSASIAGEGRGFYFTPNNEAFMAVTATLPRDDKKIDDADTDAEDHDWDQTRYRALWLRASIQKVINVKFAS